VEPKSPRPTDPDPFIVKLFLALQQTPLPTPAVASWAELQEQKRVARFEDILMKDLLSVEA